MTFSPCSAVMCDKSWAPLCDIENTTHTNLCLFEVCAIWMVPWVESLYPVSYTHLDVYKRQVKRSMRFKIGDQLVPLSSLTILSPSLHSWLMIERGIATEKRLSACLQLYWEVATPWIVSEWIPRNLFHQKQAFSQVSHTREFVVQRITVLTFTILSATLMVRSLFIHFSTICW